jgi:hypothetical protein
VRRLLVVVAAIAALAMLAPVASASSPLGPIYLTKTCDAPDHCTVQTSLANSPLPVGTEGFYNGPFPISRLSSEVVLVTPGGAGTATGHCTLSFVSAVGTCTFARGTGSLAGFHANLTVTTSDWETFTWEGTYHFGD